MGKPFELDMATVVADTHILIWFFEEPSKLSTAADAAIRTAATTVGEAVMISAISLVEIHYLIEKGRISPNVITQLRHEFSLADPIFSIIPLDRAIADNLDIISRAAVPEMPDRIIAATAKIWNLPLITADSAIQKSGIQIIW